MLDINYRRFHITFDKWVPKFVQNFRSSRRTSQFDYIVANDVANFVAKLGSLLRSSERSLELNFIEAVRTVMNSLTQQGKAIVEQVGKEL